MKFKNLMATTALAVTLPVASIALPLAEGIYDATDFNGYRSIWTSGSSHLATGTGVNNTWTVGDTASFLYDAGAGTAQMIGTAMNTGSAGADLMFNFVLDMVVNPAGDPYCRPAICDNTDESMWELFTLTGGSFVGSAGSAMEGLSYTITQKSPHGPQAGVGANDKDANELGFSMWYMWEMDQGSAAVNQSNYVFNTSGDHGDFNMDLELRTTDINEVPLPAAGWLLIAGIGGLAATRRRKAA